MKEVLFLALGIGLGYVLKGRADKIDVLKKELERQKEK